MPAIRAGFRQRDAAPVPAKQLEPEEVLQRSDLPADRALRDREFIGGLGEALMPRRCLEGGPRSG